MGLSSQNTTTPASPASAILAPEAKRLSLGIKFTLAYLGLVILPMLILSYLYFNRERNELRQEAESATILLGQRKVQEINAATVQFKKDAEALVLKDSSAELYFNALQRDATRGQISVATQTIQSVWQDTATVVYIRLYTSAPSALTGSGLETIQLSNRTNGDLSRALPETTITDVYLGPEQQPLIDVLIPFKNFEGRVFGYFVITRDPSRSRPNEYSFYQELTTSPNVENIPDADVFIFDDRGFLIAASSNREVRFGKDFSENAPLVKSLAAVSPGDINRFQLNARNFGEEFAIYHSDVLDEEVMGYYARLAGTRWTMAVEIPLSEIDQPLYNKILPQLVFVDIALLAISGLFFLVVYQSIVPPMQKVAEQMSTFSLQQGNPIASTVRGDEIGTLQNSLSRMTTYVQQVYEQQKQTADMRQKHLELLYEVNKIISFQDVDYMLGEVVRLLRDQYQHVDHAQIFLIDEGRYTLILKAGTGELGRRLIVQEHQQVLSTGGVIANTALLGTPNIVNDVSGVTLDPAFKDTRSLLIVPIKTRDEILGVLDLHSYTPGAFAQEDMDFFSAVAAELAVALRRLKGEALYTPMTHVMDMKREAMPDLAAVSGDMPAQSSDEWSPLQKEAMANQFVAVKEEGDVTMFALPIMLRDEVLGAVEWKVASTEFNLEILQTAGDLVSRLALAVDNARLFEQSQRLVNRERRVNDITQKINAQNEIRQILQVAVKELGQALGTSDTVIKLNVTRES